MIRINSLLALVLCLAAVLFPQSQSIEELNNSLLKLSFNRNTRTWNLSEQVSGDWSPVISNAALSLSFREKDSANISGQSGEVQTHINAVVDEIGRGKSLDVRYVNETAEWKIHFVLYDEQRVLSLSASVNNVSGNDLHPSSLHLLDLNGAAALSVVTDTVLMHVNGFQSWSNSEIVRLDSSLRVTSHWSTLFYEPRAFRSILLGFVTNGRSMNSFTESDFSAEQNQLHLLSTSNFRTVTVPPGETLRSDTLVLSLDSSPLENLTHFSELEGKLAPALVKPFTPAGGKEQLGKEAVPAGWCSWYYYYQNISEDSILLNVNYAARFLKKSGLKYIQIDDGYQVAAGDWETNGKFPHGHHWLVDQIHHKGFLAGLWLAPFAVAESSSIFKHHKDWLLVGEGDTLKQFSANDWWGGKIYSLDPTRPDVQKWLTQLFDKVTRVWGYDYVKIDFLFFPTEAARYSKNVSSAEAYQMGLAAIRRGVGYDRFILGCGAPIGPSAGYVDGMRIGSDVYAAWGGITPGVNAAAQRFFYHDNLWYNDPDCLVVRDPLTMDQARMWASVVALSGQVDMSSDKLPDLPADKLHLIAQTMPSCGIEAVPLDLFSLPGDEGLALLSGDENQTFHLPTQWKFTPGDSSLYKEASYDDSGWPQIAVPSRWENAGYSNLDGFAWYRVHFRFPEGWPHGDVTFRLAKIDDADETFCNGTLIGSHGKMPPGYETDWTSFRTYTIPGQVIDWNGSNTIAVRVYDGGGPGGIWSTKDFTLPSVWSLPVEKKFERWNVVGIFNWSGSSSKETISRQSLHLPINRDYLVYEFWSDSLLGTISSGAMNISLPPMSSKILSIHQKTDRPVVVSTSRHITQGAIDMVDEEWSGRTLSCLSHHLVSGEPYAVSVFVPEGMRLRSVSASVHYDLVDVSAALKRIVFRPTGENLSWKIIFE